MSRLNGSQRQKAWTLCASRDGIVCKKPGCNKPWWGNWTKQQIVDYAQKKSINLPVSPNVPDEEFFKAIMHPKGDLELIARKRLVVHHLDRNQHNNPPDGSNHVLVHQGCNVALDPRGPQRNPKFNGIQQLKMYQEKARHKTKEIPRVQTMQMLKNLTAEPNFRQYVQQEIARKGFVEKEDLLFSGAEYCTKLGMSIVKSTADGWLEKMTSSAGDYEEFIKDDPETGERVTYIRRKTHLNE
jgi:hypothetical protein